MHQPETHPRDSLFYDYAIHPYRRPPEMDGAPPTAPVVIAGAGPIGMVCALDLARFGVPCVVLEQDLQVSHGSRAIVLTRRSMEILRQIGLERPFLDKGLQWSGGRSFFRGKEIYRMVMPHDPNDRVLPGLNLQQQYIEDYLVSFCEAHPLVDLRWGQKLEAVDQDGEGVTLTVDTPDGPYRLDADWLVAADGGRSPIRKMMDLRMEGRSYPGHFVIADIKAEIDRPTERLCFFDPEWNPGNNVLVHRQPDGIWRIDFRLPDGENPEDALDPKRLGDRIDRVLVMLGREGLPWALDWATVYSANTLTLPDYVHGRVLFTGDAAHLLPIFGVRGANTGLQDCNNLAWKLAFTVRGWSPPALLDSYSQERVQAAREICEEAGKSTRFMTPPTPGSRMMRDAVLSFSLTEDFPKDLLHWRTSRPHDYHTSPLNTATGDEKTFDGGFAPGEPVRDVRLEPDDHLFDHFGDRAGFHLLVFAGPESVPPDLMAWVGARPIPLFVHVLGPTGIADPNGMAAARYGADPGSVYLLRPDMHVAARWRTLDLNALTEALERATQTTLVASPAKEPVQ
ncbi:MAG: FAD-dependent monooxygenase [Rhodospirillum sp.]|nr:FAD-dependent monooxygenase [Rhodospirillum sp.]MCF8489503.1 FAD-dependent monooxygenase [Rhodospirillum sp.]